MPGKNRDEHGAGLSTATCRQRVHRKPADTEAQKREGQGHRIKGREITGLLELKRRGGKIGEKPFTSRDWNKMVFMLSVYLLKEDSMPF